MLVTAPRDDAMTGTELAGLVTDVHGEPVPSAEVTLQQGESGKAGRAMTRTAADGRFSFQDVGAGPVVLRVRRIGFREYSRSLLADTLSPARPIHIVLEATPVALDTVRVGAGETSRMRDFYERRRTHASGHFVDRSDIQRRNPAYTSDLVRRFPGILVRPSSRGGNIVRVRGCRPGLWIDGIQAVNAELDEITRPGEIDGMEVYPSDAGIPSQYRNRSGRNCGAIFVWTRIR